MLVPTSTCAAGVRWSDLRQRIGVQCFDEMAAALTEHPAPPRNELEDEVFVRAFELLVDSLRIFGRPDLADAMEDLYYGALADVPQA